MNFHGEDFIVVTDSMLSRVWKLDTTASRSRCGDVREIGSAAASSPSRRSTYYGNVYCSDRGGRMHKFDRELRYLLSIGGRDAASTSSTSRAASGLYRRFGQLFVAEREGAQYLWFGTDVFTPSVAA
jgi:hypothetical protein